MESGTAANDASLYLLPWQRIYNQIQIFFKLPGFDGTYNNIS